VSKSTYHKKGRPTGPTFESYMSVLYGVGNTRTKFKARTFPRGPIIDFVGSRRSDIERYSNMQDNLFSRCVRDLIEDGLAKRIVFFGKLSKKEWNAYDQTGLGKELNYHYGRMGEGLGYDTVGDRRGAVVTENLLLSIPPSAREVEAYENRRFAQAGEMGKGVVLRSVRMGGMRISQSMRTLYEIGHAESDLSIKDVSKDALVPLERVKEITDSMRSRNMIEKSGNVSGQFPRLRIKKEGLRTLSYVDAVLRCLGADLPGSNWTYADSTPRKHY
jgi:hypothetical protein